MQLQLYDCNIAGLINQLNNTPLFYVKSNGIVHLYKTNVSGGRVINIRSIAIVRSVVVIGGTAALMGGVTFAALKSDPVTLADNTISTATPSL